MEEIKIPDKIKGNIQSLLTQKASIEQSLQMYMMGYMDSLNLQGNWSLDTTKWVLAEMPEDKKGE